MYGAMSSQLVVADVSASIAGGVFRTCQSRAEARSSFDSFRIPFDSFLIKHEKGKLEFFYLISKRHRIYPVLTNLVVTPLFRPKATRDTFLICYSSKPSSRQPFCACRGHLKAFELICSSFSKPLNFRMNWIAYEIFSGNLFIKNAYFEVFKA